MKFFVFAMMATIAAAGGAGAKFNYNKLGDDWGETYPLCKTSREQSPIDLNTKLMITSKEMKIEGFDYRNYAQIQILNADVTIRVDIFDGDLEVTFPTGDQKLFSPLQFHFHTPSEHTVNGKRYELELHIVHANKETGELGTVVGIFFDRIAGGNQDNIFLSQIQPATFLTDRIYTGSLDLSDFLSEIDFEKYYHYDGSLT